jgi:hypothetical protein
VGSNLANGYGWLTHGDGKFDPEYGRFCNSHRVTRSGIVDLGTGASNPALLTNTIAVVPWSITAMFSVTGHLYTG